MATDKSFGVTSSSTPVTRPRPGQLWQVPVFVLGVLAVFGVWASRPLWYDADAQLVQHALSKARTILQQPGAPANELPAMLSNALNRIDRFPSRAAEAHYLLGYAYARLTSDRTPDLWRQAREHLEEAERLGVADADHPRLQYLLAKAWLQTGGDRQRTISYLWQSIDQAADNRGEAYSLLTQAYLRPPARDLQGALLANQKQLDQPTTDENLLAPARLLRGELLLRMQDRPAARKVLSRIGSTAPLAIVSRARRLQARSYQEDEAWGEAAAIWEIILADRREMPADLLQILYSLGWCYRNLNRAADAARAWERVAQEPGEEGQAATVRLAQLCLESGSRSRALELLGEALSHVTRPEEYRNSLVNLAQARQILEAGCKASQDAGDFLNAQKLAQLNTRLVALVSGQLHLAEVSETWARSEREQAKKQKTAEPARRSEEAAREHFQEAATAYEAASEAASDVSRQADCLWHAAVDHEEGKNFERATVVLGHYLTLRPSLERLGEAWYRLGVAHQALHKKAESVNNTAESVPHRRAAAESFRNCIGALPGPFAFRARYNLAMIASQEGHPAEAEETLRQNLDLMRVVPDTEAHEKSLFAIADLLYNRGAYSTAADYWEKALELYPGNADVASARFRLAECYYHLAQIELQNARPGGASMRHNLLQYNLWLEKGAAQYQKVADDLDALRASRDLSEPEKTLLMEALFGVANCRFDLGAHQESIRLDEAIRLYDNLANRFQHQVEGLAAVRQLYYCYLVAVPADTDKARATLKRAAIMLKDLDERAFRGRPEMQNRAAWEEWLRKQEVQIR